MKYQNIIRGIVFALLSIINISETISQTPADFSQRIDEIVSQKITEYNLPGLAVGIVRNDSVLHSRGYGVKNIQTNSPVSANSIFHTASVSKLFTTMAIMNLYWEDKLSLDSKILELIPELKSADQRVSQITIKQLLNHTSGLPDVSGYDWGNSDFSDNRLENYVLGLRLKLDNDPGSTYRYSNLAYEILGYIVERISGLNFDSYLKDNVLLPAGMTNSDFRYYLIPDSLRTSPHSRKRVGKKVYIRSTYPYNRAHAPSSTLNSSVIDLSKWMISFLKSLEDPDLGAGYRQMIEPTFEDYAHIGLGFQISTIDNYRWVGHYGGDRGFRSYLMMIPEVSIGLVILGNCDYEDDFRQEILHAIARLMLQVRN